MFVKSNTKNGKVVTRKLMIERNWAQKHNHSEYKILRNECNKRVNKEKRNRSKFFLISGFKFQAH